MSAIADRADLIDGAVDLAHRWAADRLDALAIDAAGEVPEAIRADLGELGLMGLTLPEIHGGAGVGLGGAGRVVAALAYHDRSVATTLGLHLGLGSRGLVVFGGARVQAAFLPGMASGERLAAFAATEPEAGSDLTGLSTRAVLDGDVVRIDGAKVFVTNGGWARVFTVVCALFDGDVPLGKGLVVLDRGDPGVAVGPEEHKLGLRGSSTTSLHLDGVVVPRWRLLGQPGEGDRQLAHILAWGRTAMAAGCVGTADRALDAIRRHTDQRRQFGARLADLPVVAAQIADAEARRLAMRCLVTWTADGPPDALEDRSTAAKILCSEGAGAIADLAVQLHGGGGYIEETGVPLLWRDARITRIFEGANDVLLGHAGARALARRPPPAEAPAHPELAPLAAAFSARVRASVEAALALHRGIRILRRPLALHRLGRLAVLQASVEAVVAHAEDRDLAARWIGLAHREACGFFDPCPAPLEAP